MKHRSESDRTFSQLRATAKASTEGNQGLKDEAETRRRMKRIEESKGEHDGSKKDGGWRERGLTRISRLDRGGGVREPHKYVVGPVNKTDEVGTRGYVRSRRRIHTLCAVESARWPRSWRWSVPRVGFKAGKFIVPRVGGQKRRKG